MITKERFIGLIKALRDQGDYDFNVATALGKAYGSDINPYDTSYLTEAILEILYDNFPNKKQDIDLFCYELDYGRNLEIDDPISHLWAELKPVEVSQKIIDNILKHSKNIPSTHPLINDYPDTTNINDIEVTYTVVSPLKDRFYSIENQ